MASPTTSTSPRVGKSSPPSRCSSVLLPEPEAPTIASVSPGATSRFTPFSTSTVWPVSVKCLTRSRQRITAPLAPALFIAQGLGGLGACRAPSRIQRRQHREHEGGDAHLEYVAHVNVRRQIADVIHARRENLHVKQTARQIQQVVDVIGQEHAQ